MEHIQYNKYIKQKGFLKNNLLIGYTMYLLPIDEFHRFFYHHSELLQSFINLVQCQFELSSIYMNMINRFTVLPFYCYSFRFYTNTKILLNIVRNPNNGMLITEIGSIAIITNINETTLKIYNVYTMPFYRENGICSKMIGILLNYCFNDKNYELKDTKILKITLDVLFDNVPAISCYQKY